MFGPLGLPEIIFIFVLALLVFGPKRLPELGRAVGRALGEVRRATGELKSSFDTELALEDDSPPPRRRAPAPRKTEPARKAEGSAGSTDSAEKPAAAPAGDSTPAASDESGTTDADSTSSKADG